MNARKGNLLYGQSGGPTSVINATAYGVITAALAREEIGLVYAMRHGIEGAIKGDLIPMNAVPKEKLELLKQTPGSAFGSCRHKMKDFTQDDSEYRKLLQVLKDHDIRYFFYNGGNDSMDTCRKIGEYLKHVGYECRLIGLPKTVDNDLVHTDHCPGFGSAAKYIANTIREISVDLDAYPTGKVTIVEVMGRDAGWMTASAALAEDGHGPDLVYLPEVPFFAEVFLADVKRIYQTRKRCLVAVSEGIRDADGALFDSGDTQMDAFGHTQLGGVSTRLADLVQRRTGLSSRGIELNLPQRCGVHFQSRTDVEEAVACGVAGVRFAVEGQTGVMVCMERLPGSEYHIGYVANPVENIANGVREIPRAMINIEGNGMTQAFLDYAKPLIQGEPQFLLENGFIRFYE